MFTLVCPSVCPSVVPIKIHRYGFGSASRKNKGPQTEATVITVVILSFPARASFFANEPYKSTNAALVKLSHGLDAKRFATHLIIFAVFLSRIMLIYSAI